MYGLDQIVLAACRRLLGGATPDLRLDAATLERLRGHARPIRHRFYWVTIPAGLVLAALMSWGLIELRSNLEGSPANAVVDERPFYSTLSFIFAACFLTLYALCLLEHVVLPRRYGWTRDMYVRYCVSTSGWRPGRSLAFITALCAVIVGVFLPMGWNFGSRVDDHGIAFAHHPFERHIEPYAGVSTLTEYQGLRSGSRVFIRPILVVGFSGGSDWTYDPEPRSTHPTRVAAYISQKTGVPIAQGSIRP